MNIENGHIVSDIDLLKEADKALYSMLHGANADDATNVLDGKNEATIKVFGGSTPNSTKEAFRLSQFARNKRKKQKKMSAKLSIKKAKENQ